MIINRMSPNSVITKLRNKSRNKYYIATLLCMFMSSGSLLLMAEKWSVGAGYDGLYSNNIFFNADPVTDYVSRFSADIDVPLNRLNLTLQASADMYVDNSDFNSVTLAPTVEYFLPLKGKSVLFLNAGYEILSYKEMYTDFNFSGPLFQAGVKLPVGKQMLIKAGYRFQSRVYGDFGSFDFYNHNGFVECSQFFKSQTTLLLQGGINYRYYPHIVTDYDFGSGYNYYNNHGSHGQGPGMGGTGHGGGNMPAASVNTVGQTKTMAIPNLYALLSIQQSLGTRISITAETELRHNFQNLDYSVAETLIKNAYLIYPLNDEFLWAGYRLGLKINMVLFAGISLESSLSQYHKNYPGIYVLDQEGNIASPETLRRDNVTAFNLEMWKQAGQFRLVTEMSYRLNHSSDSYFDYSVFTLAAGLSYRF